MPGLLDFLDTPDGRLGLGLLAAAGPTRQPTSVGQRLFQGMQMGKDLQDSADEAAWKKTQRARQEQAWADQDQINGLAKQFYNPAKPALAPLMGDSLLPQDLQTGILPSAGRPGTPASFDMRGFANAAAGINPSLAAPYLAAIQKDNPISKVDPEKFTPSSLQRFHQTNNFSDLQPVTQLSNVDGTLVDLRDAGNVNRTINDVNQPFMRGSNGQPVPNTAYQQFAMSKARAGAPNTSVSIAGPENQYNKDIGAGLAKDGLDLVSQARQAPDVVRNAQMIRDALQNGAITGTGAKARLAIEQAMATAGLTGEGRAANTQALISGLANTTLAGVKASGLGAGNGFTDKDRDFLEAARSGTIESTPQNILRVADLSERAAVITHQKGSAVLGRWKTDPALRNVAQDTSIDPLPSRPLKPKGGQQGPGSKSVALEDGTKVIAVRGEDGNYYVNRGGKRYRVEE